MPHPVVLTTKLNSLMLQMILESHQVLQNASSMCSVPSLKVSSVIQTYNNFKASWSVSVSSKMNLHCSTPAERGHHQVMFSVVYDQFKLYV